MAYIGEPPLVKISDNDVLPDLPLMVLGKSRVPPRLKDLQRRMGPSYTQVHDAGGDIVDIVI